uniref:F-actin-capping protein subunit alpha n=1 Tax=Phaeomonas parva TaxID=124430 RepID=A0A7S1TQR4_9STRA|mmetsp:Transcript_13510/g.40053  ORF Transcript_13510/g.40053 Transcript_13510/m.40053 type:complete len:279 (+) Transcript_13510:302-1138(+)
MSDDEGYEEVSDEEKLQIAQHFLLSSPPGQFSDVLTDVKKIVPAELLSDPMVAGINRAYCITNPQLIAIDDSEDMVLVCKEGEVDATHFIDAKAGVVRAIDHLTNTASAGGTPAPKGPKESTRATLQEGIELYMKTHFLDMHGAAVFEADDKFHIVLAGVKLNLRNYWAGSWTSTWTLAGTQLMGTVKVHGHYFEDGNVQLQVSKDVPAITVDGGSDLVKSTVTAISEAEQVVQRGLEESYQNMSETTLQAIRRVMPITRTKMTWNLAAHRMTSQLRK